MSDGTSSHYLSYPAYNDVFALQLYMYSQQPPGFLGPLYRPECNEQFANNVHFPVTVPPYKRSPNFAARRSSAKKVKSFAIKDILEIKEEYENDARPCSSGTSLSQRLTPEPFQTIGYLANDVYPGVETVTSSNASKPYERPNCRLSPPCLQQQCTNPSRLSPPCLEPHSTSNSYRLSPPCLELQSTDSGYRLSPPVNNNSQDAEESSSPSKRPKRIRTIFTPFQLEQLEVEFQKSHYMVGSARSLLAEELGLTESQVKVWFQNRRIKLMKNLKETQQAKLAKLKENDSMEKQFVSNTNNGSPVSPSSSSSDSAHNTLADILETRDL